jgi:RNA recognition motif-containing protein
VSASAEVSLPARFGRRQGYAFITFEDADDVDKAVAEVNGKELLGREMRVQKATSGGPYPSENGEHAGESPSGETKKSRPKSRAKVLSAESLRCLPPADPQAQGTRRPTRDATSGEEAAGSDNSAADPSKEEDAKEEGKPRRRRVQPKKPAAEGPFDEAEPTAEPKTPAKRASRKGPPEDGIPSTTTIYVANIPFEYTDEKVRTNSLKYM